MSREPKGRMLEKWIDFYQPYFPTPNGARLFVERCEHLDGPHIAKIMMHQAQRLISLADDVGKMRSGSAGLRLLFFIICAENIAKLHENYDGEGDSKKHVRIFFEQLISPDDKLLLEDNCQSIEAEPLSLRQIVDHLYGIRCDVVHEGRYWEFVFSDDGVWTHSVDSPIATRLSSDEMRSVVVRGCINATRARADAVATAE